MSVAGSNGNSVAATTGSKEAPRGFSFENLMNAGNAPIIPPKNVKVIPAPASANVALSGRPVSSANVPAAFGAGGGFANIINAPAAAVAPAAAAAAVPAAPSANVGVVQINGTRYYFTDDELTSGETVLYQYDNGILTPVGIYNRLKRREQEARRAAGIRTNSSANIRPLERGGRRIRIRKTKKQRARKGRKSRRN